jgi:dTDP-4-dehydrorhamnose reductase
MNTVVIGSNGQLGTDMVTACKAAGHTVTGLDLPVIDLTNRALTEKSIAAVAPELIINCAAYTAVDACETNRDLAFALNCDAVGLIAAIAKSIGSRVAHISTDYVFDGCKTEPYVETDKPAPRSVYGQSKLAGERLLAETIDNWYTFRIAWLYGVHGANFVKTIRRVAREKCTAGAVLTVVNDQIGSPTYTRQVCSQIMQVVTTPNFGLFHCTGEGSCSWFDFARSIVDAANIPVNLQPCTTAEFPRPAPRPANSVLENARLKALGLNRMASWEEGFAQFCRDESNAE